MTDPKNNGHFDQPKDAPLISEQVKDAWEKIKAEHRTMWFIYGEEEPQMVAWFLEIVKSSSPGVVLEGLFTNKELTHFPNRARYELHFEDDNRNDKYVPERLDRAFKRVAMTFKTRGTPHPDFYRFELLDEINDEEEE